MKKLFNICLKQKRTEICFEVLICFFTQTPASPPHQICAQPSTHWKKTLLYLNGVESTVFGVWTTCLCGVTPEKSLSCRGVLRPPFNGVSTFVRAIRFCASCKPHNTVSYWDFQGHTLLCMFNRFTSSMNNWSYLNIKSSCIKCLALLLHQYTGY